MDWKKIVGSVAPTLATVLGGPLAGVAVKAIAEGLGLGDAATEADVAKAVAAASPETLVKLKEIEAAFATRMAELGVDYERIAAEDRDSARRRETAIGGLIVPTLAVLLIGGFLGMSAALLFGWAVADSTMAGAVIGYVSAKAEQVVSYYFGSSAGSKAKTDLMARAK